MRALLVVSTLALLAGGFAAHASAHVSKRSGPFEVEMGWRIEPPAEGVPNSVEVAVSEARGGPVEVPAGALSVEVAYGDSAISLPLVPTERPGLLLAGIVPTRAGVYSFHVTGSVRERTLDVRGTCSETTFECVEEGAIAQFPVKEPSNGELAARLDRESARAEDAGDTADGARTLAIVAIALSTVALIFLVGATLRSRGS